MKRAILSYACILCASAIAGAAEPPASPITPAAVQAPTPASQSVPKPLDLRVGDIRKYMTPEEFRALIAQTDDHTVIVKADAPQVPMKSELDVPGGIIAPFWALANPHKAWRLFLPDPRVNIKNIPPPETKVPPPVFRWGP